MNNPTKNPAAILTATSASMAILLLIKPEKATRVANFIFFRLLSA